MYNLITVNFNNIFIIKNIRFRYDLIEYFNIFILIYIVFIMVQLMKSFLEEYDGYFMMYGYDKNITEFFL